MAFGSSLSQADKEKFQERLWSKYKYRSLDFSTFGGECEAKLLIQVQDSSAFAKNLGPRLIQRFNMDAPSVNFFAIKRMETELDTLRKIKFPGGQLY